LGCATVVVPPEGTDGSAEPSEGESRSARTSKIHGEEQEFVNVYCINENNFFGCPHIQLDIGQ